MARCIHGYGGEGRCIDCERDEMKTRIVELHKARDAVWAERDKLKARLVAAERERNEWRERAEKAERERDEARAEVAELEGELRTVVSQGGDE